MADNTTLDAGSGGDTIRTEDKTTHKTPVSLIDVAGTGTESLVTAGSIGMPVEGLAAENAAVVGPPVLVGARYDASPRTLGDGDVGAIALDADGAVHISDGGNVITVDGTITANAGTGTFTVDGSGVTQPVSGTVTANLSATDNAVLDDIAAWASNPIAATENAAVPAKLGLVGGRYDLSRTNLDDGDAGAIALTKDGRVIIDDGGDTITVSGTVSAAAVNLISTNNSTATPLGISGTFIPTSDDVSQYSTVTVQVFADQDSTTDGMKFQFSIDGTNWDDTYSFTMTADETRRFQFPTTARFFRINYTNGGTGQGAFRVQTIFHGANQLTSIHRIEDNVSTDRSATLHKSAIVAQINGSGDFVPIQATASGILKIGGGVELDAGTNTIGKLAANSGVDIGDVDVLSLPNVTIGTWSAGTLTVDLGANNDVQGDVAHDAVDSGNPVKIGAKVSTATSGDTLVADADRVDATADSDGALLVRPQYPLADLLHNRTTNTDGAATAFTGDFAAAGASIKNYVTGYSLANSSATDITVDFRDGVAGTVVWTVPVPAGGGAHLVSANPLFATSANTALAFDGSAAATTLSISVTGFKSKV